MGTKDGLLEQLAALLADVCGAPVGSLGPESAPGVTPGWDSFANLAFVGAIEDELGVVISTTEAMSARTLGEMARLVAAKRGSG